jgi:hypothetical protein
MAYIGQQPFQEFASIPTKDSFTGDGSTTTFDLANDVVRGGENALEVFVNNVRQEPGSGKAFALGVDGSSNYRRITFTAAPADGASIYVINDKTNLSTIAPLNTDFNGVELVLDADADTSLHAETDDQIDLRIAGVDVAKFLQSSGDLVIKPMVDAKDIIFQQYDGNILLTIDDAGFVGIHNSAAGPGELRIYEDTDLGSNYVGFKAPNVTTSISYVLPVADGSANTQLTTNGSGVLSWTANTLSLANDANNRIITGTGSGLNGEANLTFDGSTLAVTGAITGSGDLTLQDDLILDSDAAVLSFGEDNEIALTHVADTGLLLTDSGGTPTLQFHDANESVSSDGSKLILTSNGVAFNLPTADGSSGEALTTNGSGVLSFSAVSANTPSSADGQALGSASLEWSDLFLADASTIQFGADQDVILTHVADTGLLLNSTMKLQFNDASQFIHAPSATVLDIAATDEIELTATLIDVVGNLTTSGTIVSTGTITGTLATAAQGNITSLGTLTALTVDDMTLDGSTIADSGDFTIDGGANIILDADGGDIFFKDGGTTFGSATNTSGNLIIKSGTTTALTFSGANVTVAGTLTETSSIKYKENIKPLNNFEGIYSLNAVKYDRKDGSQKDEVGFIAEEMYKVLPELVSLKEGKPDSIKYTKITTYLLEAVKDLKKEIEILKNNK